MQNLKNQYVEVAYNADLNMLHVVFNGYVPHAEFVKIVEHEYEMVSFYKLKKCLIDLRKMEVYAKGNDTYIKGVWYPEMKKRGLKHVAFVIPESVLGKMSMNKSHKDVDEAVLVESKHFDSYENAGKWLKSK